MVSVSRTSELLQLLKNSSGPTSKGEAKKPHPISVLLNELSSVVENVEQATANSGKAILKITQIDNVLAEQQCSDMLAKIKAAQAEVAEFKEQLTASEPNATTHQHNLAILDILADRLELLSGKANGISCFNQVVYNSARALQQTPPQDEGPKNETSSRKEMLNEYKKTKPNLNESSPQPEAGSDDHMSNELLQMTLKSDASAYKELEKGLQIISSLNEAIECEVTHQAEYVKDIAQNAEQATGQLQDAIVNLREAEKVKWSMKKILSVVLFFMANLLVTIHIIRP